jgi:hypothetical protein
MKRNTRRQGQSQGQGHRTRVRLGMGDFVPEAPNPFARMRYLQAVTQFVPEALRELVALKPSSRAQLLEWAAQWGFADEWALATAERHAAFWREQPEAMGVWVSTSVVSWEPVFPDGPSWNPYREPEAVYDAHVAAYKAAIKATPGMRPTPKKDPSDRHFKWLALHHVGGWPQERIAEQLGETDVLSLSTVSEGINDAAALVGVTLRPSRGRKFGHKPKT